MLGSNEAPDGSLPLHEYIVTQPPVVFAVPEPTPQIIATQAPTLHIPPARISTADIAQTSTNPIYGELRHDPNEGRIEVEYANVSMSDLVVSATFINPYSATSSPWDYGFRLRNSGIGASAKFIQVAVTSQYRWELALFDGENQRIAQGGLSLSVFDASANGRNHLQLVAVAERGWLFVNGEFISSLDLSKITGAGDVNVFTGAFTGSEVAGAVTRFESFQVIRLTHSYGPASGKLQNYPQESIEDRIASKHSSGVWTRNFVAEAEFTHPNSSNWDYGFTFRESSDLHKSIFGISENTWLHFVFYDEYKDDGGLLSVSLSSTNHLLMLAVDEIGLFFVNEQLIAHLDLSHNLGYGDVSTKTGIFISYINEPDTGFRNFNVWTMD